MITNSKNKAKLKQIDDLELVEMIKISLEQKSADKLLSHDEVKKRLNFHFGLKGENVIPNKSKGKKD